jgi:hypothetical protein
VSRLRENDPPMMPSPITPTVFLVFAGLIFQPPSISRVLTLSMPSAHAKRRVARCSDAGGSPIVHGNDVI